MLDANFILSHVVCDRDRLLALGGFDESLSHACDWDMWIRYVVDGGRIGLLSTPHSVYLRHGAAMTSRASQVTRGDIAVWTEPHELNSVTDVRSVLASIATSPWPPIGWCVMS